MNAEAANSGGALVLGFFVDEVGADDKISFGGFDGGDEILDEGRVVLAVGIELDGDVVIVVVGIFVASLDGTTDAEVGDKGDMIIIILIKNILGGVDGTVVYDDVIVFGCQNRVHCLLDGLFLVVGRDDDQDLTH